MKKSEQTLLAAAKDIELLRFLTCGSVDDGKSTLIGRLLLDNQAIFADTLAALTTAAERRGAQMPDLALLTDGLSDEREQGITIDVAYRYFSSRKRRYIIADAPGHEQYTRNMVTAASTANLAVILVDARSGVVTQTRRHSVIAHLMGIPHLIFAINKMDLVGFDEAVFQKIRTAAIEFAQHIGISHSQFVPISALNGDNVVLRSNHMPWYAGPTLMDILENAQTGYACSLASIDSHTAAEANAKNHLRFPVQWICRPGQAHDAKLHDYRGYMGRVESGSVAVGDEVIILPSGHKTHVSKIEIGGLSIDKAISGQSVSLLLADDVDVARGDMIANHAGAPEPRSAIRADICWLSPLPLDARRRYLIRHTTRTTPAKLTSIDHRLNMVSMRHEDATGLAMNDIGQVSFRLARPIVADLYRENRSTGAFIVIDESTNDTVAAGMIL